MILLGNTFPPALIRRQVEVTPVSVEYIKSVVQYYHIKSFWGHENTIAVASALLGFDVRPKTERPELVLNDDGLPGLDGVFTDRVLVLSPNYIPGYHPAVGEETAADKITGWQGLCWRWL